MLLESLNWSQAIHDIESTHQERIRLSFRLLSTVLCDGIIDGHGN
jgi:hypothetical protein